MIGIKISYAILLVIAVFFYILYVDVASLFLLLFLIILPIASGILFHISKHKLKFTLCSSYESVEKSNSIVYNLLIQNTSLVPFSFGKIRIKYYNTMSNKNEYVFIKTFIPQKNTVKISFAISSEYSGCVRAEIDKIKIYDILLLFSHKEKKYDNPFYKADVTVMPKLVEMSIDNGYNNSEQNDSDVMSKTKKGDDPSEIFDIHQYVEGDRLNRVHWKLSARVDELFVKDFSMPISNMCYIIFDGAGGFQTSENDNLKEIDTCLDGVMSFSYNLIKNSIPHGIVYNNKSIGNYDSVEVFDFDDCNKAVKILINNCETKSKIIESFILNEMENKYGQIFYFSPILDEKVLKFLEIYCEKLRITVITIGEKAEIIQRDNFDMQIYKVISGDFKGSFEKIIADF